MMVKCPIVLFTECAVFAVQGKQKLKEVNFLYNYIIEAEVFGKGILMWLLSQGKYVQLLSPEHLRAEMRTMLEEMLKRHTDETT